MRMNSANKPAILGQDQEKVVSKSGIEAMIA
jgi:hypothetical protein